MDDFKNNFRSVQLQSFHNTPPRSRPCDVCGTMYQSPAEYHCGQCLVYYCTDCVTKHNANPVFRDHHPTIIATKVKTQPCVVHPSHQVVFLCRTCVPSTTLCAICMMSHPPTHNAVNMEQTAQTARKDLQEGLDKVVKKSDDLSEQVRLIQRKCEQHDAALTAVQDDIKKHAKMLVMDIENQAGEMIATAKTRIEEIKSGYNQGALSVDLSNMALVKEEIEAALRGSNENCITSYEQLKEKIKYTTETAVPNSAKISKDIEVKFVAGSMVKNFGTLKCGGGGQKGVKSTDGMKAAKSGKDTVKVKTPKQKSNTNALSPGGSPPKKRMKKEEACTGPKQPKFTTGPIPMARKACRDPHPKGTQPVAVPQTEPVLNVPPPCEEPPCVRVCDLTAQHIFWDIQEQTQDGVTYITEICAVSTTGTWSMCINHFKPIKNALLDLIKFLGTQPNVLVGYDLSRKCELLLEAIKDSGVEKKFVKVTAGFLDTLQLLKNKFKEVESPTLDKIYKHCFGKTYGAELQSRVEGLQSLVLQTCPDRQERLSYSHTVRYIVDLKKYHEDRKQKLTTWKPIMDAKRVSRHIAEKAAASGLELKHVKKVYDEGGMEGLKAVLAKVTNDGKPRVTNRQDIIKDIGEYVAKMPCSA